MRASLPASVCARSAATRASAGRPSSRSARLTAGVVGIARGAGLAGSEIVVRRLRISVEKLQPERVTGLGVGGVASDQPAQPFGGGRIATAKTIDVGQADFGVGIVGLERQRVREQRLGFLGERAIAGVHHLLDVQLAQPVGPVGGIGVSRAAGAGDERRQRPDFQLVQAGQVAHQQRVAAKVRDRLGEKLHHLAPRLLIVAARGAAKNGVARDGATIVVVERIGDRVAAGGRPGAERGGGQITRGGEDQIAPAPRMIEVMDRTGQRSRLATGGAVGEGSTLQGAAQIGQELLRRIVDRTVAGQRHAHRLGRVVVGAQHRDRSDGRATLSSTGHRSVRQSGRAARRDG